MLTAKGATKVSFVLDEAETEKGSELTAFEKMDYALPSYIPAIAVGVASISCIVGANMLNKKQQASMMSAYMMLERSFKEYRAKVFDIYGEEGYERIEEELAKDHCKGGDELHLFYDEFSDRYFESTLYKVQRAEYELNRNMLKRDYVYLNEWYEELGIDIIPNGYALGWATFQCLEMYWQPWIDFEHYRFTTDEGRECIGICVIEQPILDFEDYC